MKSPRLPRGLGGGCRARVIELLASSPPLTVSSIARALRLSYMGVKSQCVKLEKLGYLATSQQHRARGRPELLYRLTPKGRALFPLGGVELALSLLDHAARLAGPQLPEKALFAHFQAKGEEYAAALRAKDPSARAAELAELRAAEGCFSRFESEGIPRIVEAHSPLHRLFQKYPECRKFETAAISKALGVPVYREEGQAGETIFFIAPPGRDHAAAAAKSPSEADRLRPPEPEPAEPQPESPHRPAAKTTRSHPSSGNAEQ
ncbi:MAG: transcriptional regulator, partial [Terrimicrobiaceae bacterium]|nr:transcriptional regulator [Terrimicrobiaceae bacterium]